MITHSKLVTTIAKSGEEILISLTPTDCQKMHAVMGIGSEAGELLTAVKAQTIYRKPTDMVNVIEEMGDLEWFLEHLRQLYGLKREDILTANVQKLMKRYPELVYSNEAAIARADKA